jgi:solute carrier family 25 carnitine/acylcarnitine transporter 20/29
MASPLVGVTPMFAVSFWGYAQGKKLVYAINSDRKSMDLSYGELAFAGAFSAVPQTVLTTPIERVKVILQTQGEKPIYSGPMDVLKKLYAEGGVRSWYRGTFVTYARQVAGPLLWPPLTSKRRDGPGSAAYAPLPSPSRY